MRQNNTLLFAAVFDHTDLLLRTPISAGGTNTYPRRQPAT
jgi:hypothetical protein